MATHVLTVNSCIEFRLDLQADKSPIVVKEPFFPRVVNPRYRIRGTMCNARIQSSKARYTILWRQVASNLLTHKENTSNLIYWKGNKRKQEITDLECLDHAYVVAPNKIDEDRKANLIKSIFKSWPSHLTPKTPAFRNPRSVTTYPYSCG
jgi:hypothetical protein